MAAFVPTKELIILELEVSEKIENKYLKNFVLANLKLKNISANQKDTLYINYLENTKEYQVFILPRNYDFFEFEALYSSKNENFKGFELFICDEFFVIFEASKLFYMQRMKQNVKEEDFVEFLNKKFKIKIEKLRTINEEELNFLKEEFLNKKISNKTDFIKISLAKDYSFFFYIFYLLLVFYFSYYYYEKNLKIEEKVQKVSYEEIKKRYHFNSFSDNFNKILEDINKNNLKLIYFEFKQNRARIILSSKNKEDINKFLEATSKLLSSSISFEEESNIFEALIDVEIFNK